MINYSSFNITIIITIICGHRRSLYYNSIVT